MKIGDVIKRSGRAGHCDVLLVHLDFLFNLRDYYYNTGLLHISSILEKHSFSTRCLGTHEMYSMNRGDLVRLLCESKPAVVGLYTVSDNIRLVRRFASLVKECLPECLVVVGGPYATSMREKVFAASSFDICVLGEGEYPMLAIARHRIRGIGKLQDIPGLIYLESGVPVETLPPLLIDDLDALPDPDNSKVQRSRWFQVVTGRGCPYSCIFCFQKVHGRYRARSIKSVTDEIVRNLESYPYSGFIIHDDLFITDPGRVEEFAGNLIDYRKKSGRDFLFYCQGRINILDKHPYLVNILKEAGLYKIQVGFESGHPETLKYYDKQITVEQIRRVTEKMAEIGGFNFLGNFIVGGPFEREETIEATIDLMRDLYDIAPGIVECTSGYMVPYPGTQLAENPGAFGLKIIDGTFDKGGASDVSTESEFMDVNRIREAGERINRINGELMEERLEKLPRSLIMKYIEWYSNYGAATQWFSIISRRKALIDYYNLLSCPRYRTFGDVPREELTEWFAQRVSVFCKFSPDGNILFLPETVGRYTLDTPDEILVYRLSSGKLTIGEMLEEYKKETETSQTREELLNTLFIPLFEKLDQRFHMVFYRW